MSSATTLTVGEARLLRSTWRDINGELVDPTVTLEIRTPSDATDTPSLLNPSTGIFEAVYSFDEVGDYYWEWTGTTSQGTKKCKGAACVVESWMTVPSS
jgi:hypothetical protein